MRSKQLRKRGQGFTRNNIPDKTVRRPWGKIIYLAIIFGVLVKAGLWLFGCLFYFDGEGFLQSEVVLLESTAAGRITEMRCAVNDPVTAGQPLAVIEPPPAGFRQSSRAEPSASYLTTQRRIVEIESEITIQRNEIKLLAGRLGELEAELTRAHRLLSLQAITRNGYQNIVRENQQVAFQLDARKTELQANLRSLEQLRGHTPVVMTNMTLTDNATPVATLRAPVTGTISEVVKQAGEVVTVGETLARIVRTDTSHIKAYFGDEVESSIRVGDGATISFANGDKIKGAVSKIYPTTLPQPAEIRHRYGKIERLLVVEITLQSAAAWKRILETQVEVRVRRRWF